MYVIRWSILIVVATISLLWLVSFLGWYEPLSWEYAIRVAAGIYFLIAIAMSGIMSHPSVQGEKGPISEVKGDWAFIFIVVTILLFGVSLGLG
ncbi:hypothetical protein JOD24_000571 [Kroppenstedtia sanguinis]|uniref:Uncharacterized protein n=1 Tax=Kroppenstedtia sanguinis TaxID=1380684 RepID=A0ABW4CFA8_9BACL